LLSIRWCKNSRADKANRPLHSNKHTTHSNQVGVLHFLRHWLIGRFVKTCWPTSEMASYLGYIKNAHDALMLFEACRIGVLRSSGRRLSETEREEFITSGAIFVWDESNSQIKRWTDGRKWSPSRIHGPFLIYREKPTPGEKLHVAVGRRYMIKKTISATLPNNQKLHLISYYFEEDICRLMCPSADARLIDLPIDTSLYPELSKDVRLNYRNSFNSRSDSIDGARSLEASITFTSAGDSPSTALHFSSSVQGGSNMDFHANMNLLAAVSNSVRSEAVTPLEDISPSIDPLSDSTADFHGPFKPVTISPLRSSAAISGTIVPRPIIPPAEGKPKSEKLDSLVHINWSPSPPISNQIEYMNRRAFHFLQASKD
jgi:hypothetical protein